MIDNGAFLLKHQPVILANGEKPDHLIPVTILKNAEKIVCCDGAISFLEQLNIYPKIIVGDCDSMSSAQKEKFKPIILEDNNIEYNDLQKAIKYCIANNWNEVAILGATGMRDDHFMANVGILMHYANRLALKMVSNYGIFIPVNQTTTFKSYPKQQVSIFSFSPDTIITYHNLKYPIKSQKFNELWEGSLNEAITENFTIEMSGSGALLVFLKF